MKIVANVLPGVSKVYPGPSGLGRRIIFTEDLVLVSIDGNPQPAQTPGGTHSGFVTVVREPTANDNFFPNEELIHQDAVYLFDTATGNLPAALPRGQVTVNGMLWFPKPATRTFAITGGTGHYALARGQVTESGPNGSIRTLDITL